MPVYRLPVLVSSLLLCGGAGAAAESAAPQIFHIPHLARAQVNADPAAWGEAGFRVEVMPDKDGVVRPADAFDPRFRLAWNEEGLLLSMRVQDSVIAEDPSLDSLYQHDSVEFFLAAEPGAAESYQVTIAPGADPKFPQSRFHFAGRRTPVPLADLKLSLASRKLPGGYLVEALLPWRNLGRAGAKVGDRLGLQVMVNDFGHGPLFNALWFPASDASRNTRSMHWVELADRADPPDGLGVWGSYDALRCAQFGCVACAAAVGGRFTIVAGNKVFGEATLASCDGRAAAGITLPLPAPGQPFPPFDLCLDGRVLRTVTLPDADVLRMRQFLFEDFSFDAFCFTSDAFPRGDFANPDRVEKLIGPYTLRFTYFDANGCPVVSAEKTGRYGAVVEITHGAGRPSRRFYTLYRLPSDVALPRELLPRAIIRVSSRMPRPLRPDSPHTLTVAVHADPALLETDAADLDRHAADLNDFATLRLLDGLVREPAGAVLLAGMHDLAHTSGMEPGASADDSLVLADRRWWVDFKRRYYNTEQLFPRPFLPPQRVEGLSAPVLRAGTLAEAGVQEDIVARLNEVCEAWAREGGVGFSLVVARHGVIVLDRGFGTWNGAPVTPATRCNIASTTKFLSSCLMLQAVHQGFVKLDGTVEQYLPAWRDVPVKRRMTVHELYDQTSGFPDHWNDEMNDMEELAADYYPLLAIGKRVVYQGTGHALGGKILEYLARESLPSIFRKYLFEPLGCRASESASSAAGAISTAGDLAKVGQMMCNGGAYGNLRFCTPEVVRQLSSAPEKQRLGPDKTIRWGMGIKVYDSDGFSSEAFGHPGASGAFLYVDPKYDLVLAMARNDEGQDYLEWRRKMVATILAGVR